MRKLLPFLSFILIGCHCPRIFDDVACTKDASDCKESADCVPKQRNGEAPCPKQGCEVKCPPQKCEQAPEVQIKAPKPIFVKLPQQKIVVQNEIQPQAMAMAQQQPTMQPQSFTPQSFTPQSMVPQQMMMVPVAQPQSAGPAGRARPGLTFDFIRLPIPIPRLIAVPEAVAPVQAVAMMAPQSFAPQSFAPQSFAPQSFTPQSAPAQQHVMVPVPGTVDVPVQTMMKVPYEAHVPVPVQSQAFVPQSAAVRPQLMSPQATTAQPQSTAQPVVCIPAQQAEEFYRLLEQMKKQANQNK